MHTISTNKEVWSRRMCALYCNNEECLSFSYTMADNICETYSKMISEVPQASTSTSTVYFTKDFSRCPQESPTGVYRIDTELGITIEVFCDMDTDEAPWIVIQRRVNGDVDFYRDWDSYKTGFGDFLGNFWLGNENLHLLTKYPRILRVELEAWDGTRGYAQYSTFSVSSEDQNYQLGVAGFSGDVSYDAMSTLDARAFSTYDRDGDINPSVNCAELRHCGWWLFNCTRVNINGRYQAHEENLTQAMTWVYFPDTMKYLLPLKQTKMMIR
ncbi:angiopoietin-related protein 7-like [Argopecten irradians]|uniref:angiopoietin-related protein 7-like n=1 Tax=Argopecten irradians TaxID=31199 RepID=UPI0037202AEB